jgi:hypothetical protein
MVGFLLSGMGSQFESLQLSRFSAWQLSAKLDLSWIFIGCELAFDVILKGFDHGVIASLIGFQHHEGFDNHAALFIWHPDHAAFGNSGVLE